VLQFNSRTRVDAVRTKVDEVKATMSSNIDKVGVFSMPRASLCAADVAR
jgi:hypothetical protein